MFSDVVRMVLAVAMGVCTWHASANAQTAPAGGAAAAQAQPPQRIVVTTTQVEPEMLTAWQELIRTEAIPAQKKAGVPWRSTFTSAGPGGPAFTYVTVTPLPNYAVLDQGNPLQRAMGAEGMAKYNAKLRPMIVTTKSVIQTLIPSASIQSNSATPSPLLRVTTVQLIQGKVQEWTQLTAKEFVPAFKKAGVADHWVFATNYGGSVLERVIVTPMAKWADLDQPGGGPVARALGQEAAQKLNQQRNALTANTEVTILRYLPDLSFGTPGRPTSSQ
jgi:hypothetical protein